MNVLIPTDFSENSWNAVRYAASLLEEVRANFTLLHVYIANSAETGPSMYGNGISLRQYTAANVRLQLKEWEERVRTEFHNPKHTVNSRIENNFFIRGVRKTVEDEACELIVMGTKGASGLKKYTVGSNAGDVITKVKCPVLVIPENADFCMPKHIAFPTDFNLVFKNRIIETLQRMCGLFQSHLHVVHVQHKEMPLNETQDANKSFLDNSLEGISHSFHTSLEADLEEAIQQFVDKREIDMIAMVAKNLNFFQRILFKPTVKKMSYQTKVPFLVLHE
ncbi:universal stress protein [Luteirhabdus pelagi]|uniref:universal stress protein n=1 Tax=Luteirhabdus pelagi TaxID=2792783 RepID=UPI001939669C|nr:universal stress protein [Luteirhabdus pelagi]